MPTEQFAQRAMSNKVQMENGRTKRASLIFSNYLNYMSEFDVLGLKIGASKKEIRKAYHKLAHKYHPDKEKGNEDKMKEVNRAYAVLTGKERPQRQVFPSQRQPVVVFYWRTGFSDSTSSTGTFY